MSRFNGHVFFQKHKQPTEHVFIDASLTGFGAQWRHFVYATPIYGVADKGIVQLEMLNIIIALKTWGQKWRNSIVVMHCDNWAVTQVVKFGCSRDEFLNLCLCNIWLLTSTLDIELRVVHIKGSHNVVADVLSRMYSNHVVQQDCLRFLQRNAVWCKVLVSHFVLDTCI